METMEPLDLGRSGLAPAPGRVLVAAPMLMDPNFAHTLVWLLEVNDEGALGVVLNRPSQTPVGEVLSIRASDPDVLFIGGPVATDSALGLTVSNGAVSVADLDLPGHDPLRVFAGYAGWGARQLQEEIAEGSWFVVLGVIDDVFSAAPEETWSRVLRRQVGELRWLSTQPVSSESN